jgi:hypothetical protein
LRVRRRLRRDEKNFQRIQAVCEQIEHVLIVTQRRFLGE